MWVNSKIYLIFRAPQGGDIRVHLGPGQTKYLSGWLNVDANMFTAKCDIWADLRNPLPFRSGTVSAFYSHHVVEHLPNLDQHFREIYRCLAPGGVYRVGGPNGDSAVSKFAAGDNDWFIDFPDHRRSIGGRFDNFIYCRRDHLAILTFSYLEELMRAAGFDEISLQGPIHKSGYPDIFRSAMATEFEDDFDAPHTIIVECRKPVN